MRQRCGCFLGSMMMFLFRFGIGGVSDYNGGTECSEVQATNFRMSGRRTPYPANRCFTIGLSGFFYEVRGKMNELALFAGAGGGILGGHLLGWKTVCAVEQDTYAASVLVARQNDGTLPPFPIWDDVCTFDGKPWKGIIDVVSGGFPCQDISINGKGDGLDGERSGLWSEMVRVVREVRPSFVFVENSPVLTVRGLGTVLADLAKMGFYAEWGCVSAEDTGAIHKRERIWIVAYTSMSRCSADAHIRNEKKISLFGCTSNVSRIRQRWGNKPGIHRVSNGLANRVDRVRCLGNGQVPRVAAAAFNILSGGIK